MARHSSRRQHSSPPAATAWDEQSGWYDARHGEHGDEWHRTIVVPAVLRHLRAVPGQHILDCCCGQGVLARALAAMGCSVEGIDASEGLIERARKRAGPDETYRVADARALDLPADSCDHAAVVLALQDLDPIEPVLAGIAKGLKRGGRCAVVLVHPCFRPPRASDWHRDGQGVARLVRSYLAPQRHRLDTHPGTQADDASTVSHHRPVMSYINAFASAGLPVVGCEELATPWRGKHDEPQWQRAAAEIPTFLVLVGERPRTTA